MPSQLSLLPLHSWLLSMVFLYRRWRYPFCSTTTRLERHWSASSLCKLTIKANILFGSHARHKISALKGAGADWWPSKYKRDEVIAMIRQYKEELIAVARRMRMRHIKFWEKWMKIISHVQPVICKFFDYNITKKAISRRLKLTRQSWVRFFEYNYWPNSELQMKKLYAPQAAIVDYK